MSLPFPLIDGSLKEPGESRAVLKQQRSLKLVSSWLISTVLLTSCVLRPPVKVPEGKTAKEYYSLGIRYKAAGWTEHARDALSRSIHMGKGTAVSERARRYLETKLPRFPAPADAVRMNIEAFNSDDRAEAERLWRACIEKYPNFEWAYGNLGHRYVREGRYKEGEELLERALAINPSYINGWLHLADSKRQQRDFAAARSCVKKALDLDPDDPLSQIMNNLPSSSIAEQKAPSANR